MAISALFGATMAYVALVDMRSRRIPNIVTIPGTGIAIAVAAVAGPEALVDALLGVLVAGLVTGAMYIAARGRFGMGDVKLAVFGGAVLGVAAVPGFLILASLLGSFGAIIALIRGGGLRTTIAYGPYLAITATVLCLAVGPVSR